MSTCLYAMETGDGDGGAGWFRFDGLVAPPLVRRGRWRVSGEASLRTGRAADDKPSHLAESSGIGDCAFEPLTFTVVEESVDRFLVGGHHAAFRRA